MRAILLFTLATALCIVGAWWVAALPGSVSATVAGTTLEAPTPVALTLLAILFLLIYLVVRVLVWLWRLPRTIGRASRARNRRRGDHAVTRALVALAANDSGVARKETGRARRLLGDTPLTLLLSAQARQQGNRPGEAQEVFRLLADRTDAARLLGLRGLLRQAVADQDWPAAAALAKQAEAAHPGAAWLVEERRRMALQTGQWREAMRLSAPRGGDGGDPGARAALGVAAAEAEKDPMASLRIAKEAFDADPALGPAALGYAGRLRAIGKERAALDALRRSWAALPQPGVSEAYVAPLADKLSRMRGAEELAAANPNHPDTFIMLARTALDAGLVGRARRYAESARSAGMDSQRLLVLLADLAEADRDTEAAQEALRQIPTATPDPVWQCGSCATVHGAWHPVCDACGTPGRIRWTAVEGTHTGATPPRPVRSIEGFS